MNRPEPPDDRPRQPGPEPPPRPLRTEIAAALAALRRKPGLKPGGRAAGAAAVILTALILALALLPKIWPPGPVAAPETGVPITTDQANRYLTDAEIEKKIIDYIALTAWAEQAGRAAIDRPESFPEAMMTEPNPRCAGQFRENTVNDLNPDLERERERLLECAAAQSRYENRARPRWEHLSPLEREARARANLTLLWNALNPETVISVRIAWQQAAEVNRQNNDEFRQFAAAYAECESIPGQLAPRMAQAADRQTLALDWTDAAARMRDCAFSVNEKLFPQETG